MKREAYISVLVVVVLVAGLAILAAACASGNTASADATQPLPAAIQSGPSSSDLVPPGVPASDAAIESLSTFRSKDPFIPQAIPPQTESTVTTTPGSGGTTSSTSFGTTTTYHYTTTTRYSGTTTTTQPKPTTTTTAPHLHTLKILSVATVSGAPVVTFRVDSTTYKDKRAGDVVSTTWGQVKVVDISTSSKVVTLLHGSETLILGVGQSTYE